MSNCNNRSHSTFTPIKFSIRLNPQGGVFINTLTWIPHQINFKNIPAEVVDMPDCKPFVVMEGTVDLDIPVGWDIPVGLDKPVDLDILVHPQLVHAWELAHIPYASGNPVVLDM